jgi:hypothetical protein
MTVRYALMSNFHWRICDGRPKVTALRAGAWHRMPQAQKWSITLQPRLLPAAACLALLNTLPTQAHHSFSAEFDGTKPVRLIGTITGIEWTNPHSYFYLKVRDSKGANNTWACESGNPGALSRRGWKKGDIKLGDALIVDGFLAKDGSRLIDARRVKLPDGRTVYGGSAGDGGPGDPTAATPPEAGAQKQ